MLDADTFMSPESEEVARLAAGAVLTAVDHVLDGSGRRARWRWCGRRVITPRRTARWASAFTTTSPSARPGRDTRGLARVAIVDYDVHHGNGTQWMFYDDPTVLFVSSHQFPFYPGTGAADETGQGCRRRLHGQPAAGGGRDRRRLRSRLQCGGHPAAASSFGPSWCWCPPASTRTSAIRWQMRMTTDGFGACSTRLLRAADELCDGRMVFVTEGGYDTQALAECCQRVIALCASESLPAPASIEGDTRRGERSLADFRRAHRR